VPPLNTWFVYLVHCRDESLYCGIATSVPRRIAEHNAGKGARYIVPKRRPVVCVWKRRMIGHGEALRLEYWVKQLTAPQKRMLADGLASVRRTKEAGWRLTSRKTTARPLDPSALPAAHQMP
jgi:putative endonuclease